MKAKKIIALSLVSLILLSSCRIQEPGTDLPTTAPSTPNISLKEITPNERTFVRTVFSPHDLKISLTTDKESYAPGEEANILVNVKNIGKDYEVPDGDVFSEVNMYYLSDDVPFDADPFEPSDVFDDDKTFKKGSTIKGHFSFSLPSDMPLSSYSISF